MRKPPKSVEVCYAGFDLSLTASGVVVVDSNGNVVSRNVIKSKFKDAERLNEIQNRIRAIVDKHPIKFVCIEGYAFGAKNNREVMGEVGGVIRLLLFRKGINFTEASPGQVKKFATGSGGGVSGGKDQVTLYCYKNWGFTATDNNEADAFVLSRICLALHKQDSTLQKHQAEVVKTILDPPVKKKKKKLED